MSIDHTGLASPFEVSAAGLLLLFIPDDGAAPVLIALAPATPTPAQHASIDLLVRRKLSL